MLVSQNRFDFPSTFGDFFGSNSFELSRDFDVDCAKQGSNLVMTADLPGVKLQDVDVKVDDGILTISGKRSSSRSENGEYSLSERVCGTFSRSFNVPSDINVPKIEATLKNGVLTIVLPCDESKAVHMIKVKGNE